MELDNARLNAAIPQTSIAQLHLLMINAKQSMDVAQPDQTDTSAMVKSTEKLPIVLFSMVISTIKELNPIPNVVTLTMATHSAQSL